MPFSSVDLTSPPSNLKWNMSPAECLEILGTTPIRQGPNWIEVRLRLSSNEYEARLWITDDIGLTWVNNVLGMSEFFSEDSQRVDEIEAARALYEEHYKHYIEEVGRVLGPPTSSSTPDREEDPQYEVGGGITYWNQVGGRVELMLCHEGKLNPFELYLSYEKLI